MKELLSDVFDEACAGAGDASAVSAPDPIVRAPVDISEPTEDEIAKVDTLEVARSLLLTLRRRFNAADALRVGPLAEKILSAVNRIEQIERNRPRPPSVDEVNRRLQVVRADVLERIESTVRADEDARGEVR
jgi:hypothetical protein